MPAPAGSVLALSGVTHSYGPVTALKGIDLSLNQAEFTVIFGPNGAGKTTLLKILATLVQPTRGTVGWGTSSAARDSIGFVSHRSMLYDELTGLENLVFFAGLYGLDDPRQRAEQLCRRFGLSDSQDYRVGGYSRGMRQRLTLARALLHRPRIVLLDEPFTGLDQHGARALTTVLKTLKSQHRTIVMVTHNLSEGFALGSRMVILNGGRLVYDARREDISLGDLEAAYFGQVGQKVARQ